MNRILALVRHGRAQPPSGPEDHSRKLTAEGERDVRHVGRWMVGRLKKVDVVISSTAIRARQTAEIIVEEFRQNNVITYKEEVYEASIRTLLQEIHGLKDSWATAMVVGHNPAISYLADYLTGSPLDSLSPGSVVIIELGDFSWAELSQHAAVSVEQKSPSDLDEI